MKFIDKLISFIFSLIIIVLAMSIILVSLNIVKYAVIDGLFTNYLFSEKYTLTVILISLAFIALGLKVTVFSSALSVKSKKNIYVNTANGKIQIAQETIEGIAKSVIKNHNEIKDVKVAMTKVKKGINMYMGLVVYQNTNITNAVTQIQDEVKKQIESTTSVKVYNVDVKIINTVSMMANNINVVVPKVEKNVENQSVVNELLNEKDMNDEKIEQIQTEKDVVADETIMDEQ